MMNLFLFVQRINNNILGVSNMEHEEKKKELCNQCEQRFTCTMCDSIFAICLDIKYPLWR